MGRRMIEVRRRRDPGTGDGGTWDVTGRFALGPRGAFRAYEVVRSDGRRTPQGHPCTQALVCEIDVTGALVGRGDAARAAGRRTVACEGLVGA